MPASHEYGYFLIKDYNYMVWVPPQALWFWDCW